MSHEHECPSCRETTKLDNFVEGVCYTCYDNGMRVDPAGDVHDIDEPDYDPAKIYE